MHLFIKPGRTIVSTLVAVGVCIALTLTAISINNAFACPFCSAINLTFSQQLKSNDVVVIAKLIEIPPPNEDPDAELAKAEFEIVDIVKGQKWVSPGMKFRTILVGRYPAGQKFMVMGIDPPSVAWSTPMKASDRLIGYLKKLEQLPKSGVERLVFFQDYFEDKEPVLAFDAYDEFARAPYEDLIELKDQMPREKLIQWVNDPETSINRRRLYFTMLGVCGTDKEILMMEEFLKSGDRKKQAGLDALIAGYLNLKGEAGVQLIEDTFIKDKSVDYVDTLGAISALRFHGTEVDVVPKTRIVEAIRHLLDRPKMADMIIPDLARWEDWSVMERLVQMFKDADEDTNWLRVPVITYLRACPKPEAKTYIEELSKIDPDAVRRADFFLDFGDDEFDDDEEETETETEKNADADDDGAASAETETPAGGGSASPDPKKTDENDGLDETMTSMPLATTDRAQAHLVKKVPISVAVDPNQAEVGLVAIRGGAAVVSGAPPKTIPADSMAAIDSPIGSTAIAQAGRPPAPVASAASQPGLTMMMIFVPMAISLAIFLLIWSVINGWFERLIV